MVARGALADASVTLVGKPKFAEITTGHNDKRTIGIVKVIGSAMVRVSEAAMIIDNEKKVYESYAEGIESTGSTGDLADLRIGFFAQFIGYLSTLAAVPIIMEDYRDRREFIKLRFGVELEELPEQVAPVIATIPKYVE